MGNKKASKIVGLGDTCLETSVGCKLLLKDIRNGLDIWLNLTSAGKFDDNGYANQLGEGKWNLTKGSLVSVKGRKMTLFIF